HRAWGRDLFTRPGVTRSWGYLSRPAVNGMIARPACLTARPELASPFRGLPTAATDRSTNVPRSPICPLEDRAVDGRGFLRDRGRRLMGDLVAAAGASASEGPA